jgi:membrane protease subunit (stomatin/prohibitin family)
MVRIFDIVEFFDETGRQMVHRLPEHGSGDFRLGSQLIVRESQAAVFFRDGKALDTFGPGRHTLSTANIPFLTRLISIPFSGETPFKAEVYFVNLREFLEQKWGTPEAITLRDSELGMVRLRAFGTYSMQVNDPQLFVNKVVGTQGIYQTSQIQGFLRGIIIAKLTDLLGEVQKSILDLPSLYDEIGAGAKAKVQDDFNALGIALKTLYVTSISPTEETAKAIDERASMGAIGNMQAYLQFKTARAMTEAAGVPGGMAGAGVGLGAGVGMGAAMAQMMTQAMQPGAQAAAATMMCPSCSTQIPAGSKFCPQCGGKIGGEMICPNCKADVPDGSQFCPNCGTKIA